MSSKRPQIDVNKSSTNVKSITQGRLLKKPASKVEKTPMKADTLKSPRLRSNSASATSSKQPKPSTPHNKSCKPAQTIAKKTIQSGSNRTPKLWKPKPAHSGVPVPEKMRKMLDELRANGGFPLIMSPKPLKAIRPQLDANKSNTNVESITQGGILKEHTSKVEETPMEVSADTLKSPRLRSNSASTTASKQPKPSTPHNKSCKPAPTIAKKTIQPGSKRTPKLWKPKPAHSGVPVPEKMRKMLDELRANGGSPLIMSPKPLKAIRPQLDANKSNTNVKSITQGGILKEHNSKVEKTLMKVSADTLKSPRLRSNSASTTSSNQSKPSTPHNKRCNPARTSAKKTKEWKPKPAHSGVPVPEKMRKMLDELRAKGGFPLNMPSKV